MSTYQVPDFISAIEEVKKRYFIGWTLARFCVVLNDRDEEALVSSMALARKAAMQSQPGIRKGASLTRFIVGAHPVIEQFINLLRVRDTLGTYMPSDGRMRIDDERVLTILIHNILTTSNPLYEMADWLQPLDAEKLGLSEEDVQYIQDDKMGRALERFYDSRHKDVFFRLALRAIKVFKLDCKRVHHDTTSITFAGKYGGWSASELLTHGYNKDHRPDLKQLVLGLNVTSDGAVPLSHRIYSGNQTDDRLHPENHRKLQKLLQRTDFIYVADSKLATDENLGKISAWQGRFVTVMPRTWKEADLFRVELQNETVQWKHILTRKNNRHPDSKQDRYYVAKGNYKTLAAGYRLHWIRSTQKAEQDKESRAKRIAKAIEELQALQTQINTYYLKTRKAIVERIEEILQQHRCNKVLQYEVDSTREYKRRYSKKGRPSKNSPSSITWHLVFSISFQVSREGEAEEALSDGVFPLITNLDPESYTSKRILEIYKFQPFLEKRYTQLKTYQEIAPVYLKKAKRVVAFLHMHVMALMVGTLVERKLRRAMRAEKLDSLPIYPEKRPCQSPTIFDIVRLFRNVERYEVTNGDDTIVFPAKLTREQKQVLRLLEIPESCYH